MLVLMALAPALGCAPAGARHAATHPPASITILHTNDQHAHLLPSREGRGGSANIAAVIKRTRQQEPGRVLVLDAGDMTQGTPVSTIFNGLPIYEVMNAMGYDAATLGNHEFDNGSGNIAKFSAIAHFPIISSNVLLKGRPITGVTSRLVKVGGLRVGLLALTTHESISGAGGMQILGPEKALGRYLPTLRKQADLIVVLSHLGVERDQALAAQVPGIDVIVGGHSHTPLERPLRVGQTLIVQAGFYGQWLGRLDLTLDVDRHRITRYEGKLISIPIAGLAPDPETQHVVRGWEDKVAKIADELLGQNPTLLSKDQVRHAAERIWRDAYGADFGYVNSGGVRDGLPAGPIHVRDLYNIFPFNNKIVILDLDRRQVVQYASEPLFRQNKALYQMVMPDYDANLIVKRFNLPADRVHPREDSWRQPLIDSIRRRGTIAAPALQPLAR